MILRFYAVSCNECGLVGEELTTPTEAWRAVARQGWTREFRRSDADRPEGERLPETCHYCVDCSKARPKVRVDLPVNDSMVASGERLRERKARGDACDTVDGKHGDAGIDGRCPYCRRKIITQGKPESFPVSNLTMAYARAYDPDWGGRRRDFDA